MTEQEVVRELVGVLERIRITGPDRDNVFWLHIDNGRGKNKAGINLGTQRDIGIDVFKEFEIQRNKAIAKAKEVE
jgi:hypothetical protein